MRFFQKIRENLGRILLFAALSVFAGAEAQPRYVVLGVLTPLL